jgi:hypothetical protein
MTISIIDDPDILLAVEESGSTTRLFDPSVPATLTVRALRTLFGFGSLVNEGCPVIQLRADQDPTIQCDRARIRTRLATRASNEVVQSLCRALVDQVSEREFRTLLVTYLYDTVIMWTQTSDKVDVRSQLLDNVLDNVSWNPLAYIRSGCAKRHIKLKHHDLVAIHSLQMSRGLTTWIRVLSHDPMDSVDSILARHPAIDSVVRVQHRAMTFQNTRYEAGHIWIFQLGAMARVTGDSRYVFQAGPSAISTGRRCLFEDFARDLLMRIQTELHTLQAQHLHVAWTPRPEVSTSVTTACLNWARHNVLTCMGKLIHRLVNHHVWKYALTSALTRGRLNAKLWMPLSSPPEPEPKRCPQRTRYRGEHHTSLVCPYAGRKQMLFGRLGSCTSDSAPLHPDPRLVAATLMRRTTFKPSHGNLWAAAWIQFQVHGWMQHQTDPDAETLIAGTGIQPLVVGGRHTDGCTPLFRNQTSHWWDGSMLYGDDGEGIDYFALDEHDGMLQEISHEDAHEQIGMPQNTWFGLQLLHHIFAREHNLVADLLQHKEGLSARDARRCARLVVVALMAKIHTTEWTPQVFHSADMSTIMNSQWHGLTDVLWQPQEKVHTNVLTQLLAGLPRMANPNNMGHHRAFTEEFVSVYRMHSLLPDRVYTADGEHRVELEMAPLLQRHSLRQSSKVAPLSTLVQCMFATPSGRLDLQNYPHVLSDAPLHLDVVDIVRDREIGVPRYAEFRERMGLSRPRSFADITPDLHVQQLLQQVYETVDSVDVQIGMMAEPKRDGWIVSDTAFQVFIVEATRRIQSDRFLCADFTPDIYTPTGFDWVQSQTMYDVAARHLPNEGITKTAGQLFFAV